MSAQPRMFLVFDGTWLEVEASLAERRGGLRTLAREAETKWNLQPNLYELRHASGKVDSPSALQRALEGARNGVCKLEITESLEGKMMRTMHAEMKLLEERVMAKVEATLTEVRKEGEWNGARLTGSIAPMVQCIAQEHIELRSKVGELCKEVNDLGEQITLPGPTNTTLKDLEVLEHELQQECAMQAACDLDLATTVNQEELTQEVCQLSQKQTAEADRTVAAEAAPQQACRTTIDSKQTPGHGAISFNWPLSSGAGYSYSNKVGKGTTMFEAKWRPGDKWSYVQLGDEVAAPFAQSIIQPPLYSKSGFTHRSCPQLPPLY